MSDSLVTLPATPSKARRAPFPWLAAAVPMTGGLVLWGVTGSMFSLLFALLGPLIAVASMIDSARGARRSHRAAVAVHERQLERAGARIAAQHERERAQLGVQHPDVMQLVASPPRLWRAMPGDEPALVVARGDRPSACRVTVADDAELGEPSAVLLRLRARAATLRDAPITVGILDGVMITGEEPFARAAARALVLQLCMTHAPGALHLAALPADGWEWARELPHLEGEFAAVGGAHPAPLQLGVVDAGEESAPPRRGYGHNARRGDVGEPVVRIVYGPPTTPVDPRCGALIELRGADGAAVLTLVGHEANAVTAQLIGEVQARTITTALGERAATMFPRSAQEEVVPPLDEVLAGDDGAWPDAAALRPGCALPAPFMVAAGEVLSLDIVSEGPHALVAGMTGSGKSELLVSWVSALCALYPPERVVLLLADFKGGTAFASLAELPHVVGMITDLDAAGASRALESLRAEVRWREARLADAGARDIADGGVEMPRLLVVIDEFAALLAQHPALHDLFVDIAARGRALGIHLVLGTQRAAGAVRDALLANIPLRVCLRVVDEADSRTVVGAPGAAALSAAQPGAALVRRPNDNAPVAARVVRSDAGDRDAASRRWAGRPDPRRPWLPPLPTRLDAAQLPHKPGTDAGGAFALGLLDEPAVQRQRAWWFSPARDRNLLVVGGPGSGRSTVLRMVEHAARHNDASCVRIGTDREHAWDTIERLASGPGGLGSLGSPGSPSGHGADAAATLILIDDLDALIAGFPGDYAAKFAAHIETLLREGVRSGVSVVATVQRMPIAGTRIGEAFNSRLVLGMQHRADHLATGADPQTFVSHRPAGRGVIDGTEVQIALPPDTGLAEAVYGRARESFRQQPFPKYWCPPVGLVSVVSRAPGVLESQLRAGWAADGVVVLSLRTLPPGTRLAELAALGQTVVVIGDADAWQQHWSLLAAIRAGHPLVIDGGSWGEFRALTGSRELPPYIAGDAAWLCAPEATVTRVRLPKSRSHAAPTHVEPAAAPTWATR